MVKLDYYLLSIALFLTLFRINKCKLRSSTLISEKHVYIVENFFKFFFQIVKRHSNRFPVISVQRPRSSGKLYLNKF